MANNLVIGGNTYENVEYVYFQNSDGNTVTFVDSTSFENSMKASLASFKEGIAQTLQTASITVSALGAQISYSEE